jgi:hypothetical protein
MNDRIKQSLNLLKNDGKQTPMKGQPVFIAQHATTTRCRGCISKWHGIEKSRALSENKARNLTPRIQPIRGNFKV